MNGQGAAWAGRQQEVARAISDRLAGNLAPGVVGLSTRARVLQERGAVWSAAQLELWRDTELAWLNRALFAGGAAGDDPGTAARIGLALADIRVRDVAVVLAAAPAARRPVAQTLWPVVSHLQQPWRAPAGTVLAVVEWTSGRDPRFLLDFAAAGQRYRLAEMLAEAIAADTEPDRWYSSMAKVPPEDLRHGTDEPGGWALALESEPAVVLGCALSRAGWALQIAEAADTPSGPAYVGYLLRDHTPVGVVESNLQRHRTWVSFPGRPEDAAAWERATANAAVTAEHALAALATVEGLDLAAPPVAGRLATSPQVLARTDQIIDRGPARGPRLQ